MPTSINCHICRFIYIFIFWIIYFSASASNHPHVRVMIPINIWPTICFLIRIFLSLAIYKSIESLRPRCPLTTAPVRTEGFSFAVPSWKRFTEKSKSYAANNEFRLITSLFTASVAEFDFTGVFERSQDVPPTLRRTWYSHVYDS